MKKWIPIVLILLQSVFPAAFVNAQSGITVKGRVTDNDGKALRGVSVLIKERNTGTTTDSAGNFSITIPKKGIELIFSFVGYNNQELRATEGFMDVKLMPLDNALNDVVVVGYGTQKRVSLTSAVSQISGQDLARRPVASLEQSLQGQVPGLTILDKGGQPGNNNTPIVLRGVNTLYSTEDLSGAAIAPLVLVDGVEQPFSNINTADIETVSVLKDASSTAIYGSRASNGVILITTKRGKSGKVVVNYGGYYAVQKSVSNPEPLDLESYLKLENLAYKNVGSNPPKPYRDGDIDMYVQNHDTGPIGYPLPYDWYRYAFHTAPQINNTLSVSGGNEKFSGRLSLRSLDQGGIIDNTHSNVNEIRVNTDFIVSPRITVSADLDYRYEKNLNPYGLANIFQFMTQNSIWAVPQYPNGDYGGGTQGNNPLLLIEKGGYNRQQSDYIVGNIKGTWNIIKGLNFTTQFAARATDASGKLYQNTWTAKDSTVIKKQNLINSLTESRNTDREYTLNNLLDYSLKLGDHGLKFLLGYSQILSKTTSLSAYRQNFYNDDVQSIGQGANDATKDNGGADAQWGLRSYFGRFNYNFRDKYLFETNARLDGSSRFTGDKQYSFFPSFSAGWRLSQEKFWSGISHIINDFKIRGSWGQTGNQAVALYSYFPTLNLVTYSFGGAPVSGYAQTQVANPNITWETTTESDIGMDAQFLNRRLNLTVDYYKKRTSGILLTLPVPGTLGLQAGPSNAGVVDNKGWEFQLSSVNKFGEFGLAVNLNLAINKNEVVDLAGTGPFYYGTDQNPRYTIQEGYPIYSFWGYKTNGLYQTDAEAAAGPYYTRDAKAGDVRYVDMNNDNKIDASDQTYLGNTFPKYTFGSVINLSYKSLSLNIALQGTAKSSIRMAGAFGQGGNYEGMVPSIYKDNYWTPETPDAYFPRPTKQDLRNQTNNDMLVLDASYLRFKNVQLAWQLPQAATRKLFIDHASLYVSATNVLTFSKLNDWNIDPESMSGVQNYYPQTQQYTVGLNIQF